MPVQDRYPNFLDDQCEFFDALITEDWATYFSEAWDETRRYEVACLFGKIKPKRILDIGCGCGFHDREMALYPFVEKVDAFDYSAKSIERANNTYAHPKVKRWVGDFAKDLPSGRYDLVVSFQVVEHLRRPDTYFQFCRKACVPHGHAAIFTPNRLRLHNRIRAKQGLPQELLDPQHFNEYSIDEIKELGVKAGFVTLSHFGYGLSGHKIVDNLPNGLRLRLGRILSPLASGVCLIFQAPSG